MLTTRAGLFFFSAALLALGCTRHYGGRGGFRRDTDATPERVTNDSSTVDEDAGVISHSRCAEPAIGRVRLPDDDAVHTDPVEWWYWTGHLRTDDGRWFGFEQSITSLRLSPLTLPGQTANFAITDISDGTFHFAQGTALGAPVELRDAFDLNVQGQSARGGGGRDTVHGEADGYTLDLSLDTNRRAVLQFGTGYVEPEGGGNTYYYSRPQMRASGTLEIGSTRSRVTGTVWFDHQWGDLLGGLGGGIAVGGASSLGGTGGSSGGRAWTWMAFQLEGTRQIMVFELLDASGNPTMVGGSDTDTDCNATILNEDDVDIQETDSWTRGDCTYPIEWDVTIAGEHFHVVPVMKDQELRVTPLRYWEGAALIDGDAEGRAYVEMIGFCQ